MFRQEALLGGSGRLVVRPAARPVPAQAETPADHRNISQGPGAWSPHPPERKPRTSPGDHRLDVRIHQKTGETRRIYGGMAKFQVSPVGFLRIA